MKQNLQKSKLRNQRKMMTTRYFLNMSLTARESTYYHSCNYELALYYSLRVQVYQ